MSPKLFKRLFPKLLPKSLKSLSLLRLIELLFLGLDLTPNSTLQPVRRVAERNRIGTS
jgi:hypothetical protein